MYCLCIHLTLKSKLTQYLVDIRLLFLSVVQEEWP